MALRSEEGMNLSPVELAVPMSEQTPTTAGHGLDLLGPVVIEGSPEALQTVAIPPEPFTSQIVSDTSVADIETDEPTETLNTTIVPTPAMHLAADITRIASSVCGAGAAGTGPPPSGPGAALPPVTSIESHSTDTFTDLATSSDPSLAPNMLRPTAMSTLGYRTFTEHEPSLLPMPRLYSSTQTTYDVEQSQSALENIGQFGSERSSKDTLEIGDDIEPEMRVAEVSKFFKLIASSQPTTALGLGLSKQQHLGTLALWLLDFASHFSLLRFLR